MNADGAAVKDSATPFQMTKAMLSLSLALIGGRVDKPAAPIVDSAETA
jgi:hypothetical protein